MKRPTFRLSENKHKQLMLKLMSDDCTFQEFGEYVVNLYLEGKLKINKESVNYEN